MNLFIQNETAELEAVILGIGIDIGVIQGVNPKIRHHIERGTLPKEEDICREIQTFEEVFLANGVEVLRPANIPGTSQIFTRDIGFVIDDYFFIANMKHPVRSPEIKGIQPILNLLDPKKVISLPEEITIEGGDVMVWNDFVFIGLGDRTTPNAIDFFANFFPKKQVVGIDLVVDQHDFNRNILHLDCAFQPIGKGEAIIYKEGFASRPDVLYDVFSEEKCIEISQKQMVRMFPNIFSISPSKIVIEKGFDALKAQLTEREYEVFEVDYRETSKFGGLLRCSTLPLRREK
jgi:N-dimethylarginine dimethylaminohydrolase